MPKESPILELFTNAELVQMCEDMGCKGWSVLSKYDIIYEINSTKHFHKYQPPGPWRESRPMYWLSNMKPMGAEGDSALT